GGVERLADRGRVLDRDDPVSALARVGCVGPLVGDELGAAGVLLAQLEAAVRGGEVRVALAQLAAVLGAERAGALERALGVRVAGLELDVTARRGHVPLQPTSRRHGRPARIARMPGRLIVVEHPVLADRLVTLRDRATSHGAFRRALEEASAILAIEATRDLPTRDVTVETPLEPAHGRRLLGEVAIVPVLRAGLGMIDGFLRLLPDARVGHLGMYRDEDDHA